MAKNPSSQHWFQHFFVYHCDDCGGDVGYRSRPRTFSESYLLPLFLLQPVRCAECFRRDYRLIFMPVRERMAVAPAKDPARAETASPTRNVA